MPLHHTKSANGQLLIALPRPIEAAVSEMCALGAPGAIVLAVPPMICAGCGKPRSLFVNRAGRTVCVADCSAVVNDRSE